MGKVQDLNDWVEVIERGSEAIGEVVSQAPGFSAYGRAFCRVAAGTPGGALLRAANVGNACSAFWEDDGITPPTEDIPFSGGQCAGVNYFVTVDFDGGFGVINTTRGPFLGPISGVSAAKVGSDGGINVTDANGTSFVQIQNIGGNSASISGTSLSRQDGQPDNCGDPEPQFNPSPDAPGVGYDQPQVVTGPDGRDYTITVREPREDGDGNVDIGFEVDGIDFNFGPGPSGGGTGFGPSTGGSPITGGPDAGERDVPEVPAGGKCIAIAFEFFGFQDGVGVIPGSEPNVRFYRVFGNAAVQVESDDGQQRYARNVDLQSQFAILAIPAEGLRIVRFKANLEPGLSYIATPIYRNDVVQEE